MTNSHPPTAVDRDNELEHQLCGYPGEHGPHGVGIYACDGLPLPPLPDSAYPDGAAEIEPAS